MFNKDNVKPLNEASCKVVLDRYDKSKDGRLDFKELQKLVTDFVGPELSNEIDARSVLALSDIDASQHIEVGEVSNLLRSLDIFIKPDTQAYLSAIWKKYDGDHSKLLEKNEIGQVLSDMSGGTVPSGKEIDKILRRVSKDGDLDISKFEFMYVLSEWFTRDVLMSKESKDGEEM
jgi:Ca2+-binding EF-hand superfamily protein